APQPFAIDAADLGAIVTTLRVVPTGDGFLAGYIRADDRSVWAARYTQTASIAQVVADTQVYGTTVKPFLEEAVDGSAYVFAAAESSGNTAFELDDDALVFAGENGLTGADMWLAVVPQTQTLAALFTESNGITSAATIDPVTFSETPQQDVVDVND